MNAVTSVSEQAQVSEAAYANFFSNSGVLLTSDADVKAALIAEHFSGTQAAEFVKRSKVVDQFISPVPGGVDTGFSATVFERLDPATGQGTGEMYFAVRGSEANYTDWVNTNFGDIGGDGIAVKQGIDMYNYYLRLTGTKDSLVPQYQYVESRVVQDPTVPEVVPARFERIPDATASGELSSNPAITAVGHSMGGHLAMMLSRITQSVSSVTTFNAPGFDSIAGVDPLTSEGFFSLLSAATGQTTMTNPWRAEIMSHFDVHGDIVQFVGVTPGVSQKIFTESIDQGPYDAHIMSPITDSLAVYDLFARMDDTLTVDDITGILTASDNTASESLESAITALGKLLEVSDTTFTADEFDGNRDLLYKAYKAIGTAIDATAGLIVESFFTTGTDGIATDIAAAQIAAMAGRNDDVGIAYRYALENLDPFVVTGNTDLYAAHNADGHLNADRYTRQYLLDRSHMLERILLRNAKDTQYVPVRDRSKEYYEDIASGTTAVTVAAFVLSPDPVIPDDAVRYIFGDKQSNEISGGAKGDHLYGGGGIDRVHGGAGNDYIEGNAGRDFLFGEAGTDTLVGGAEDDVLDGGLNNDTLEGGAGMDTYWFNADGGADTIIARKRDGGVYFQVDLHKFREAAHYCQPLGDDRFREQIEQRYGIKLGRMARGRPTKGTTEAVNE